MTAVTFHPRPPRIGDIVRPSRPGALVAERGGGHMVVVQPVLVGSKNLPMVSIGVWWTTPEGEHAPDGRKTCLIHVRELPELIHALQACVMASEGCPPSKPVTQSFQAKALLALANGYTPPDLPAKLWPGEESSSRRLTELGKALRRAGLLEPGTWNLTSLGKDRASALLRAEGEARGELPPHWETPYPRLT